MQGSVTQNNSSHYKRSNSASIVTNITPISKDITDCLTTRSHELYVGITHSMVLGVGCVLNQFFP